MLLHSELRKQRFQKCECSGKDRLLVIVAIEEEIVYLSPNRGTGVL